MTDLKPMNKTLADSLASLLRTVEEKKQRQINEETITPMAKKNLPVVDEKIMLPAWPNDKRAIPHPFVRSALFGIVKKGERKYLKKQLITSVNGLKIMFTGETLDQSDLDVYLAILHHLSKDALGNIVEMTSYELLKSMGLKNGNNYEILDSNITRMVACAVHVDTEKYHYVGSLLEKGYKDKDTKKWVLQLNPDLLTLFKNNEFAHLDFEIRTKLKGQLAKWLFSFYSSHEKPFPYKVETLKELCGSETKELFKFKQQIQKALDEIVKVSGDNNVKVKYEIINGCVHFERISVANLLKKIV
jgi:hypothetical protein